MLVYFVLDKEKVNYQTYFSKAQCHALLRSILHQTKMKQRQRHLHSHISCNTHTFFLFDLL